MEIAICIPLPGRFTGPALGPWLPAMSRVDPMARALAVGALVVLLLLVLLLLKVA